MSHYHEPPCSTFDLTLTKEESGGLVCLQTADNVVIEVASFAPDIWSLELRYDKVDSAVMRQIHTGVQDTLEYLPLSAVDEANTITLTNQSGASAEFNKKNAAFSLRFLNGFEFLSSDTPFSRHPDPKVMYKELESLQVPDLTRFNPAPFTPPVEFYSSMTRFQYPLPLVGPVIGLPGQTGEFNRRGYRFELYNTDNCFHAPNRSPMYQSWPILIHFDSSSEQWYGVFHDNPARTYVDIGYFYDDKVTFESITGNTRLYFFAGASLEEISRNLSQVLGASLMPPAWAFGYQQCRWSYMSTDGIRGVKQRFDNEQIPLDALYFDIDYMDGYRVFSKNEESFGDLAECVSELKEDDIQSVCIIDPGVKIDPEYEVYTKIKATNAYLKNEDGSPFVAKVWPGEVLLPDFLDSDCLRVWCDLQNAWLQEYGFAGVWNDMNEPANFDGGTDAFVDAQTTRGPFRNESNLYGYGMARASFTSCRESTGPNPFVISRSGYPGVQRYAVIWHGDNHAWWEHLRLMIDTCIGYSICGAYYTGADVPGFFESAPDDLAIRFFQAAAFLPMYRGHSWHLSKDKEPYAFANPARQHIVNAIQLRYSLLREWYSGFEYATRTNTPPILPCMADGYRIVRDQFLLFGKFLVAPIVERDQVRRTIYLPPGNWYLLGDQNSMIEGDAWHTIEVNEASLPVYVKAGSILVRNAPGLRAASVLSKEYFECYQDSGGNCSGYWFDQKEGGFRLSRDAASGAVEKAKH